MLQLSTSILSPEQVPPYSSSTDLTLVLDFVPLPQVLVHVEKALQLPQTQFAKMILNVDFLKKIISKENNKALVVAVVSTVIKDILSEFSIGIFKKAMYLRLLELLLLEFSNFLEVADKFQESLEIPEK